MRQTGEAHVISSRRRIEGTQNFQRKLVQRASRALRRRSPLPIRKPKKVKNVFKGAETPYGKTRKKNARETKNR